MSLGRAFTSPKITPPPPCVFLLEVQYSVLKSLISTCVLSYVGSRRKERIGYLTESASLKRTAGIV